MLEIRAYKIRVETKPAFLAMIEIWHLYIVYCGRWLVLCASGLNSNSISLKKNCPLSETGLTDPTLQQGDQNLPMGHIFPGPFSAENTSPCIHGRGNIPGSTSTVFPPQESISRIKESTCGCRLLMDPTFFRSTRTSIPVKVFVELFFWS